MTDRGGLRRRLATVTALVVALLVVTAAPASAAQPETGFDSFEDGQADEWTPHPLDEDQKAPSIGITEQGATDGQYALTMSNKSVGFVEWTEFMRNQDAGKFYNITLNSTVNVTRGATDESGGLVISTGENLATEESLEFGYGVEVHPANDTLVLMKWDGLGSSPFDKRSLSFDVKANESYQMTLRGDQIGKSLNASIYDTNGNRYWLNSSTTSKASIWGSIDQAGVTGTNGTFDEFNYTVDVLLEPTFNESTASPTDTKASSQSQLSIQINDTDFPKLASESVDAEFYHKGPGDDSFSKVGTDTLSSNGTATVSGSFGVGEHEWYVNATDAFGLENESSTFTFGVQGYLKVYDEADPDSLVNGQTVNVTFYGTEGHTEINETDTGIVSMQGLPSNQSYVARIKSKQYTTRELWVPDTTTNRTAFLQERTGAELFNVTFELQDRTSRFPPEDTVLIIQRPINQSDTLKYRTVVSEEFGASSRVQAELISDQRYRLIVENRDGEQRVIGPYEVTQEELVPLQIGGLRYNRPSTGSYDWDANHIPEDNGPDITFNYTDSADETDRLRVIITNRTSETVIHDQTYRDVSSLSIRKDRGADDSASYNVTFVGKRDGEDIGASVVVGPRREPGIPLAPMWQQTFAVGMVIVVAGGFAGFGDQGVAAVAAALVGGIMWFIGWLPPAVGGGIIALAIAIGAMWLARGGEA